MKTVLYVSGNTALWICFKRRVIVDFIQESITINTQSDYTSCRWLKSRRAVVHLLVDSEQSEIDAHPLLEVGSNWSYRSNKQALQHRLKERFPDAIIRTAAKKNKLGAALVQHINLPEATRSWLSYVESGGISFCSMTTVSELLADRLVADAGASVIISVAEDFIRHTYCRVGHALFTRAVAKTSAAEHADQFKKTLDYLNASALMDSPVAVYVVGLSVNDTSLLIDNGLVSELINVDAQILPATLENILNTQFSTELSIAGQLLESVATSTNNSDRHVSFAMQKHEEYGVRQRRSRYFAMVTTAVLLSLGYTFSKEWQRTDHYAQLSARKGELSEAIKQYQDKADDLSPKAVPLSNALLDALAIEAAAGVSPSIIVALLAEAFTQYQELELQELNWVVVDAVDQVEEASYGVNASKSVSVRTGLPRVGEASSVTMVTLAGKIVQGDSLREQHKAFNALTALLEQESTLSNLTVLQAPLMQFDGTDHIVGDDLKKYPEFQLQFDLGRSVSDEA